MAEGLNCSKFLCPICLDTLRDKCYTFVNCGHVICFECHNSLELAASDPWTDPDEDFWGIPLQINSISKSVCVLCRKEGRRQRLYLTEEIDEEKKELDKKVKDLEKMLDMQMFEEKMRKLEEKLYQSGINERALEEDDRPEVVPIVELVATDDTLSRYCVRCGSLGHLAREKVCVTPAEGKSMKRVVLGNEEKYKNWRQNMWERNRKRFEDRWIKGQFVPRCFYEQNYAGVAIQVDSRGWVKKI